MAPMGVRMPARRAAMLTCACRNAAGSRVRNACAEGKQTVLAQSSSGHLRQESTVARRTHYVSMHQRSS